jgi:hypothetical protein
MSCPKEAGKICYAAPDGAAEKPGETLPKPTTLEAAIEVSQPRAFVENGIPIRSNTKGRPLGAEAPINLPPWL